MKMSSRASAADTSAGVRPATVNTTVGTRRSMSRVPYWVTPAIVSSPWISRAASVRSWAVRGELDGVHVADRTGLAGQPRHRLDVGDGAGAVRSPVEGGDPRTVAELGGEVVHVHGAGLDVDVGVSHAHAAVLGCQQPRR